MLAIENVSKTFNRGTANEICALDDVSLTVRDGEFLVVIGGNGGGKSTILNAVAGVCPVDAGAICIAGQNVTHLPEHRRAARVGRVFQDPLQGTAAGMTIEENLALAALRGRRRGLARGLKKAEREGWRESLAGLGLGLEDRMQAKVGLLSGGQRQALTLLMATLRRPDVLLLDEHTAALDPATAQRVMELSDTLVRRHRLTCLMVTHNMRHAATYGDRLLMMAGGRVAWQVEGAEKGALSVKELAGRFDCA